MISFIIPAYNAEKTIDRTIRSIQQIAISKEIIVVENGSSDGTTRILASYQDIIVLHSEKGVSKARNLGIDHARGEWISFVDADDECLPGIIEVIRVAEENRPDILIASYLKDNDLIKHDYTHNILTKENDLDEAKSWLISKPTMRMESWAKLYKRSFLKENDLLFNEKLCYSEDSEFVIRALNKVRSLQISEIPIYKYRSDAPSVMRSYSESRVDKYIDALREAEKDIEKESAAIKTAFRDYVITHINIISVHDIFGWDVKLSLPEKKQMMKNLLHINVIKEAVRTLHLSDMKNPNNIPSILFKYHFIYIGGFICYLRSIQNKKRYQKAESNG